MSFAFLPMLLLSYSDYSFAHSYFVSKCRLFLSHRSESCEGKGRFAFSLVNVLQALGMMQVFIIYAGALYYNLFLFSLTLVPSVVGFVKTLLCASVLSSSLTHIVSVRFKSAYFKHRLALVFAFLASLCQGEQLRHVDYPGI